MSEQPEQRLQEDIRFYVDCAAKGDRPDSVAAAIWVKVRPFLTAPDPHPSEADIHNRCEQGGFCEELRSTAEIVATALEGSEARRAKGRQGDSLRNLAAKLRAALVHPSEQAENGWAEELARDFHDAYEPWQVERDRFGVMFSGPLEVGEMIEVVPAADRDRLREALERIANTMTLEADPSAPLIHIARAALSQPSDSGEKA